MGNKLFATNIRKVLRLTNIFLSYLYKFKIIIYVCSTFTHSHFEMLVWIAEKAGGKMTDGTWAYAVPKKSSCYVTPGYEDWVEE